MIDNFLCGILGFFGGFFFALLFLAAIISWGGDEFDEMDNYEEE